MPEVPTDMFIDACKQVVKANQAWLAPYGTGATLYLRPFLIGVGDNVGVNPAPEYISRFSAALLALILKVA